jgi:hypothetical protein
MYTHTDISHSRVYFDDPTVNGSIVEILKTYINFERKELLSDRLRDITV